MPVREGGYKDTRVRIQRVRDAKFFSGWIVEMSAKDATVSLNYNESMEIGDIIVGEVSGRENRALFDAAVAKCVEDVVSLEFRRTPRYEQARESSRTIVRNVCGSLSFQGEVVDVNILDVSVGGVGISTYAPLAVGGEIKLSLETPYGPVKVSGQIRYCRNDPQRMGLYRAGAVVTDMGRLDRARWNKLNCLADTA